MAKDLISILKRFFTAFRMTFFCHPEPLAKDLISIIEKILHCVLHIIIEKILHCVQNDNKVCKASLRSRRMTTKCAKLLIKTSHRMTC